MKKADVKNEKGFILVLALVTMVAMSVIGLSLILNMTTDMQLARNEREAKIAFQLAEAGINEAIARLHLSTANARYIGELTTDANYRASAWNVNNSNGKNFGAGFGGNRNSADNLNYTVSLRYLDETNPESFCDENDASPNTTVNHPNVPPSACDEDPAEIVMFGRDFNISDTVTKISRGRLPVYEVTSTGTSNQTSRTIVAYIGASSLNTDTEYGINTNSCVDVSGSATAIGVVKQGSGCGCDPKIIAAGGSCAPNKTSPDDMTTYLGEDISAVINMADERHKCKNATCSAAGDDIPSSGKIDTIVSDWGDFFGDGITDGHSTLIYIDNSGGKEAEISGNFVGRGILVVSGDLKLTGTLQYEGLVYVLGTLRLFGGGNNLNVLGGIMANSTVDVGGNINVVYDQQTLLDVAKESSSSAKLVWKRL